MATSISYTPLEASTINSLGGNVQNLTSISSNPSFSSSTSLIWTIAFVIIIVTASFRYAYAGMLRIQASEKGIKDSKEEFTRVTYGLLGVLGLWLILFTVNKDMLMGGVDLGGLRSVKGVTVPNTNTNTSTQTGNNSAINNPPIPKINDDPTGWLAIQNDSAVRTQLRNLPNGGIGINKSVCNNPTQTSCTTVGGWPPGTTFEMLSQLRNVCSGTITVTGGTESGHSSHGPGKTPVDLSLNSPGGLEACIRAFPIGPSVSFCKKTYVNFGYTFCDENLGITHWHVYK